MNKTAQIYWTFFKSFFTCQHLFGDLTIDELIERLKDEEEDGDNFEHWRCACTCKCGEKKEQVFALTTYLGVITERYEIREAVRDAVLAQAALDEVEKLARQKAEREKRRRYMDIRYGKL